MSARNLAKPIVFGRVDRFWAQVNKDGECWLWTGHTNRVGYGVLCRHVDGKPQVYKAHRYSYALHFGDPDPQLLVCHRCDNPLCVRPEHLFLGTNHDNMRDMATKGRAAAKDGAKNGYAKLSAETVIEIRERYAAGLSNTVELAAEYRIANSQILEIVHGESWTTAGGPLVPKRIVARKRSAA